jgi:hypothetical protein
MKQVDGEQAQFATEPDDQSEVWAGSSKIFWAIAALIVLILGTLLAFRFGTEVRDLVLYWLGLVGAAPVADYEGGGIVYRMLSIVILSLFIPFTALSYIFARRRVRKRELQEACRMLEIDYSHYAGNYNRETRDTHFLYAVMFTFVVTILGLTAVILGAELNLHKGLNLLLRGPINGASDLSHERYQLDYLLFFGLAFLGAYLWGLQEIIRRYFANDLVPGVYYTLGVRMIFAAIVALLVYHIIGGFDDGVLGTNLPENVGGTILPLVAFVIGIFPQRALQYFTDRISMFTRTKDAAANEVPLELVQGISVNNRMRLREEGIESCFDLAHADFVRMLFTTPFPAKQLIDWIMQAKLCVFFPDKLDDLRQYGIRCVEQLRLIDQGTQDTLNTLASDTKLTHSALQFAKRDVDSDKAVDQLLTFRERLDSIDRIRAAKDEAPGIKQLQLEEPQKAA